MTMLLTAAFQLGMEQGWRVLLSDVPTGDIRVIRRALAGRESAAMDAVEAWAKNPGQVKC